MGKLDDIYISICTIMSKLMNLNSGFLTMAMRLEVMEAERSCGGGGVT